MKYFNKLFITGMFIMFACGPGDMVSKVQAQAQEQCVPLAGVKKNGNSLFKMTFGSLPLIATIDKETSIAFDKIFSEMRKVEPEKDLDQIVHFTNGKYDLIVYMYKGCATVSSKLMNTDFLTIMGKIEA